MTDSLSLRIQTEARSRLEHLASITENGQRQAQFSQDIGALWNLYFENITQPCEQRSSITTTSGVVRDIARFQLDYAQAEAARNGMEPIHSSVQEVREGVHTLASSLLQLEGLRPYFQMDQRTIPGDMWSDGSSQTLHYIAEVTDRQGLQNAVDQPIRALLTNQHGRYFRQQPIDTITVGSGFSGLIKAEPELKRYVGHEIEFSHPCYYGSREGNVSARTLRGYLAIKKIGAGGILDQICIVDDQDQIIIKDFPSSVSSTVRVYRKS